jgi:hypothetical protein
MLAAGSRIAFAALLLGPAAPGAGFTVHAFGLTVEATLSGPGLPVARTDIVAWVEAAARDVVAYLGRAPVPRVPLRIRTGGRGAIGSGRMFGGEGDVAIRIDLGRATDQADLATDWVMTHELFHLALPDLPDAQQWMEEGFATYLEPIARAQRGRVSPEEVWTGLVAGLPKGQVRGDHGLDDDGSWGATYWGGAGYWLQADLAIRERTAGRKTLKDALRGILAAGGNGAAHWSVARTLDAGDAATGVPVLRELYEAMGPRPGRIELDALWKRLGVVPVGGSVRFDERAPQAALRRAITRP